MDPLIRLAAFITFTVYGGIAMAEILQGHSRKHSHSAYNIIQITGDIFKNTYRTVCVQSLNSQPITYVSKV
jgi:hypothetical protein